MKREWFRLFSIVIICLMVSGLVNLSTVVRAQEPGQNLEKVESKVLDTISLDGVSDYIVEMAEKADLSAAYDISDWNERGWFVYDMLKEVAARTQKPVITVLEKRGVKFQSFFAANEIAVFESDLSILSEIASLEAVSHIRFPRTATIDPGFFSISQISVPQSHLNALDWGITDAKADQFWSTFGSLGSGIVVANIDTGVQWNHPALDQAFKCGTNASDPACWADPSNICGGSACDNNGHGTHTMGTMVGDDDPSLTYQVGMAPDAQWIACKGCESNDCSDTALNGCADWILAPGGNPANRPNIVNNSWGGGGGDTWYLAKVNAWRASGIFPVFSTGNSGSTCSSIGSPSDYQVSFAVANHMSSRTINPSSSRGPSTYGDEPYTKPNISAPGTNICSSIPGSSWSCAYTGTSMAAPHVAGAVALLWSCNPTLIGDIGTTFELLQDTADAPNDAGNCGAPADGEGNFTYGYGYLNVYQAGSMTCQTVEMGTLEGFVYDNNSFPIEGASVVASGSTTTDPSGYFSMNLPEGTYSVTASKYGHSSQTVDGVVITANETTRQNFTLEYLGGWMDGTDPCFNWTRYDAEFYPGTGLIYVLGGRSESLTYGDIYSYDPETGACQDTGANMPVPISNYTVNLVNNGTTEVLCTFGGRTSSGATTLAVQCYNPTTNTATQVTTLPTAWTGFTPGAQAVHNNKVYIFGGFNASAAPYETTRTERFDPITNTFTQLGPLSLARSYLYTGIVDGKIYAFGGTIFDGVNLVAQGRAEVMADPDGAGTWDDAAVADLPIAHDEGVAFGFDTDLDIPMVAGKVVLVGGGQWPGESADVWTYDPVSNTYEESFPDLINARRNHAGVFVPLDTTSPNDGLPGLWVMGGRQGSDSPPYQGAEFFPLSYGPVMVDTYLPMILR